MGLKVSKEGGGELADVVAARREIMQQIFGDEAEWYVVVVYVLKT